MSKLRDYPFNINNAAKSSTVFLATVGTIVGLRSFTSPLDTAETFGLPQSRTPSSGFNAFIPVCGGRNLASGVTMLAFAYQQNWRAVGTLMCCGVITAVTDATVCFRYGDRDAAVGHGVASVLSLGLGVWFLSRV